MELARGSVIGPASDMHDYGPVLKWLLITCLVALGFVVLWYLGLVQTMFETDRTHISNPVLAVFVATSLHCLVQVVQVVQVSRELVPSCSQPWSSSSPMSRLPV